MLRRTSWNSTRKGTRPTSGMDLSPGAGCSCLMTEQLCRKALVNTSLKINQQCPTEAMKSMRLQGCQGWSICPGRRSFWSKAWSFWGTARLYHLHPWGFSGSTRSNAEQPCLIPVLPLWRLDQRLPEVHSCLHHLWLDEKEIHIVQHRVTGRLMTNLEPKGAAQYP